MLTREDSALEQISNRKSVMTLFNDPESIFSHMVRLVLFEKGIAINICDVDANDIPEDFQEINPYGTIPTLVDRELIVYDYKLIIDYLDERFPHPPLMPVDPVVRAQFRIALYRINQDWFPLLDNIYSSDTKVAKKSKDDLVSAILSTTDIFKSYPYFLSEDFSMLDCIIAPLLYKLNELEIELPRSGNAVKDYLKRVSDRDSFKASLNQIDFIIED